MERDKLLREAVADAKMVVETAVATAKLQLEESFTPRISRALAKKLRNENLDTSNIAGGSVTVKEPGPTEPSKNASASSKIVDPEGEGLNQQDFGGTPAAKKTVTEGDFGIDLDGDEDDEFAPQGGPEMGAPEMGGGDQFGAPETSGGEFGGGEGGEFGGNGQEFGDGSGEDELDLNAIIQELEADLNDAPTADPFSGGDAMQQEGAWERDPNDGIDQHVGQRLQNQDDALGESAEVEGAKGSAGVMGGGKEVKPGQEVADFDKENKTVSEEINLEEILREVEAEGLEDSKTEKIANENVNLKSSLREHRTVIQYLRNKLQEVNMLNAKLLYTNKLFRSYGLSESQKMTVIGQFDRAVTLREVKLLYTTLAENFAAPKKAVRTGVKNITEGMASIPVSSTKPKAPQIINEGVWTTDRMKKLAGIRSK